MRKLRDAVLQIAQNKKSAGKEEAAWLVTGGFDGKLKNWDRDLENGKITATDAISKVKGEFSYHWSSDDYKKLEDLIK